MLRMNRSLLSAFCLSLLVHLGPFLTVLLPYDGQAMPAPRPPPLQATLQLPPPTPSFILPETTTAKRAPPAAEKSLPAPRQTPRQSTPKPTRTWTSAIREQFAQQQKTGQFYPEEAIRLGLEGEAQVLMMLDSEGNVVAARVEASSGHELLDRAALAAVRRLRTLPADAPQEAVLPVRFRLR